MIPLVYGYSSLRHHGVWLDFHFDGPSAGNLLTLLQSGLALMVLANMEFDWRTRAVVRAVLVISQPNLREAVAVAYGLDGDLAIESGDENPARRRYFWRSSAGNPIGRTL